MDTKAEILIKDWLNRVKIPFKKYIEIQGARDRGLCHQFDFVIESLKTVIEVNGCYSHGHGCQRTFPTGVALQRMRDRLVDLTVGDLGWKMIRRWECEVVKNPACIAKATVGVGRLSVEVSSGTKDNKSSW